jgi:arylsulfatase A-like enzyme
MKFTQFQFSLLISVLMSCFLLCCQTSRPKAERKPNVLFIAIDDMNDWIGPLGGLNISKTPNLDKLAAQSLIFENAHCAAPACHPSRLAIMTGVQPSKSNNLRNVDYDGPHW